MTSDQRQSARITWRDEKVPVSARFDDPYFSVADGLAETRHVFLHGNRLPDRFRTGFHIGELGFGTGLSMLCAWQSWLQTGLPGPLRFTSFEAYPMAAADIAQALSAFPELTGLAQDFLTLWQTGATRFSLEGLEAEIVLGDARQTLPRVSTRMDAWFLDGFAPAKNPELWEPGLMAEIAAHTKPGGRFSTYTAAGHVRRSLAEVGFVVDRIPGFGRKRHMTTGYLKDHT